MFDAHPSFRFRHRREEREFELEIRASLLRWLLIAIVTLACLAGNVGPSAVVEFLFKAVPHADSSGDSLGPSDMLQTLRRTLDCSCRPATKMSTKQRAQSKHGKKKPAQSSRLRDSPSDCPTD
jgi:hypothetical protein